jgi:uncharacterized protein YbjT (DUF2867 family)
MKKTILVVGDAGAPAKSVASCLLQQPQFNVRYLTAKPANAHALEAAGAEIVTAYPGDTTALLAVLEGCHGVFVSSNIWEAGAWGYQEMLRLIDAVAVAQVPDLVWAGTQVPAVALSDTPLLAQESQLETYLRRVLPHAVLVRTGLYYEHFLDLFAPHRAADGVFQFGFPQGHTPLPAVSLEDLSVVVGQAFDQPEAYRSRTIRLTGEAAAPGHYAQVLTQVTGKKVQYNYVPRELYPHLGLARAAEIGSLFDVLRQHVPSQQSDLAASRSLYPGMQTFEEWATQHRTRIDAVLA